MTKGNRYLFYIYVDKSGRLAATTDIFPYLSVEHSYNVGDRVDWNSLWIPKLIICYGLRR